MSNCPSIFDLATAEFPIVFAFAHERTEIVPLLGESDVIRVDT